MWHPPLIVIVPEDELSKEDGPVNIPQSGIDLEDRPKHAAAIGVVVRRAMAR